MILTKNEKNIMIQVLRTLIYNDFNDLKNNILEIKGKLSKDKYNLLLFGDKLSETNKNYKMISSLDNRWCLESILNYHLNRTKKISQREYEEIISLSFI